MSSEKRQKELHNFLIRAVTSSQYFTVADYFNNIERQLGIKSPHDRDSYRGTGLFATDLCADRGIEVGTVLDSKFGKKNTYPEKILAEVIFGNGFPDIFPGYDSNLGDRYPIAPRK